MVAQAQRSRAPMQRMADTVSYWFVLVVLAVAVATFLAWGLSGRSRPGCTRVLNAVAVLIIACPCALGPGHADVDHGRNRARRAAPASCSAMPRRSRRCAGRHAGRGQDRHADRSASRASTASWPRPDSPTTKCCGWRPAWTRAANIRWPRRSSRRQGGADWPGQREEFDSRHRHRRARSRRGHAAGAGQQRADGEAGVDVGAACGDHAERAARRRRQRDVPRGGRRAGRRCSASPIRSRTTHAAGAATNCARRACASIMATGDGATTAQAVARRAGHRRGARRSAAAGQARPGQPAEGRRAGAWRWPATASTMRRRWRRPTSASPWAPAPTWRCPARS